MGHMEQNMTETLGRVALNGGRDTGRLVREAGEDGGTVYHAINETQRLADRLRHGGFIDPIEHQAATVLRDAYDRAGLAMGYRQRGGSGGGTREVVADEEAWTEYRRYLIAAGEYRLSVESLVIDEQGIRGMDVKEFLYLARCGLLLVAKEAGLCS